MFFDDDDSLQDSGIYSDKMDQQQQYCLKWSNYSSNMAMAFSNLYESDTLTDVILLCGGQIFKAHKLILAACSQNFAELFETAQQSSNGSTCVILEATSADNMQALLEFMYKGEVHVSQTALESFLKAAESLQVKGLTAEHGRFNSNANAPHPSTNSPLHDPVVPITRRNQSQLASAQTHSQRSPMDSFVAKSIKRETDMILHSSPSALANYAPNYMPSFMPHNFPEHPRKRSLKSPYGEQESPRGSVLRDGSKGTPVSSQSPVSGNGKRGYGDSGSSGRPASSASSVAPTEADTQQMERNSPQQSNRYENHSPSTTHTGNNGTNSERDENEDMEKSKRSKDEGNEAGAEDLRVKMELRSNQSPIASSAPETPTSPLYNSSMKMDLSDTSLGSVDMLNAMAAHRDNVHSADGKLIRKKLQCPLCERQYGYETNLRAHIRQRHQGIRVPCPYCSRTFTRNNTVRRHIAREHKSHYMQNALNNPLSSPHNNPLNQLPS
ncbi:zinc finger protein chinmo [Culicoides brevitarsis]|uniref:zinc finger protein chinmo n=1 Tax=Culicoides brevitarsis TaxID=469753 RepID=UPI00307B3238